MLLANSLKAISIMYSFFLIWHVLVRKRKIIFGYLLTLLIVNLHMLGANLSFYNLDNTLGESFLDPILKEYSVNAEGITDYGLASFKSEIYEESHPKKTVFGFRRGDSVEFNMNIDSAFLGNYLTANLAYIDLTLPKLRFNRNKAIFKDIKSYHEGMVTYLSSQPCDTCSRGLYIMRNPNGQIMKGRTDYVIDSSYLRPYIDGKQKADKLYKLSEFSELPVHITRFIFLPTDVIVNYLYGTDITELW